MHCLRCQRFLFRSTFQGRRRVSSLTPLGAAFNSRPQKSAFFPNNLKDSWKCQSSAKPTGLFGIEQLTRPEGFDELKLECAHRSHALLNEACSSPPERQRIVARVFDELSDELCRVADMAEFVRLAHPDRRMAEAAENACITVSGLVERLNTDVQLFEALRVAVEGGNGDVLPEEDVDKHVAKLFLLDFYQCGIHLPDEDRQRVVELNDTILQIGQQFSANSHKPRIVKKLDLPSKIRHHFNIDGDNVILSGLQVDTPHDLAREAGYKIYYWEDPSQEKLLSQMVDLRHQLAQLCGYETFAHRAMMESLGGSPEKVSAFLNKLSAELKPRVAKDCEAMLKMKSKYTSAKSLQMWDVPYFSMQARGGWFDLDTSRIAEFFSLGACMEGLDTIFKNIFGVRLQIEDARPGELWHKDVYKVSVQEEESGEELGLIYCDFFIRSGKPHQDCHFTIR
jgi:intermediate peptidase